MSLSPSPILDLRKERERQHAIKVAAETRMAAIDAVLGADGEQVSLPLNGGQTQPVRTIRIRPEPHGVSSSANNGLRAAILDALKRNGGSGRARDVARQLDAQGFANNSKTALNVRVYNDLWRLSQTGAVTSNDGVFSLKEGTH
jgi:hypothetical protein